MNWPPRARVFRSPTASVMLTYPSPDIRRDTAVERAIRTLYQVEVVELTRQCTRASDRPRGSNLPDERGSSRSGAQP
jgi:hypothetical protein